MITIKDFSEKTGFSVRMLRYLEEFNLLKPTRGDNNYRYYQSSQIEVAQKVRLMQNLGLQLNEIRSLLDSNWEQQVLLIEKVFIREKEIAEAQSELIPRLYELISKMKSFQLDVFSVLNKKIEKEKSITSLAGDEKFQRTAFFIPALKLIYDDLSDRAEIDFLEIDFCKFACWLEEINYTPRVYSFLKESSFAFGTNLTSNFLLSFKTSWEKFLNEGEMVHVDEFSKDDVNQLMGSHDVIIRGKFTYKDGTKGEVVIPYAPVFTMTKLK